MGRVLALLWHVDTASYLYPESDYNSFLKNANNVNLESLFIGIDDLSQSNAECINSTLQAMVCATSSNRSTIDEAIQQFSAVSIQGGPGLRHDSDISTRALNTVLDLSTTSRQAIKHAVYLESKNRIANILQQISSLKKQAVDLEGNISYPQVQHLWDLADRLEGAMTELHDMDEPQYNTCVIQHIQECQDLIRNNRDYLIDNDYLNYPTLVNIGLAIAGLAVFYLAAGMVNLALTGNFLFFNNHTNKLIDDVVCSLNQAGRYSENERRADL